MGIHSFGARIRSAVAGAPTGQVAADSQIGQWIEHLCSLESVRDIVEIGTWRGNGTTRRISDGIARRRGSDATATCLEVHEDMAKEAAARYRNNAAINVVWGRVVDVDALDASELTQQEEEWLAGDVSMMSLAPNVLTAVPPSIDLLVLDGGEFATLAEYLLLKDRVTGWIVLDDTRMRKCREILRRVASGEERDFQVVDESSERNGMAVLHRVKR